MARTTARVMITAAAMPPPDTLFELVGCAEAVDVIAGEGIVVEDAGVDVGVGSLVIVLELLLVLVDCVLLEMSVDWLVLVLEGVAEEVAEADFDVLNVGLENAELDVAAMRVLEDDADVVLSSSPKPKALLISLRKFCGSGCGKALTTLRTRKRITAILIV